MQIYTQPLELQFTSSHFYGQHPFFPVVYKNMNDMEEHLPTYFTLGCFNWCLHNLIKLWKIKQVFYLSRHVKRTSDVSKFKDCEKCSAIEICCERKFLRFWILTNVWKNYPWPPLPKWLVILAMMLYAWLKLCDAVMQSDIKFVYKSKKITKITTNEIRFWVHTYCGENKNIAEPVQQLIVRRIATHNNQHYVPKTATLSVTIHKAMKN